GQGIDGSPDDAAASSSEATTATADAGPTTAELHTRSPRETATADAAQKTDAPAEGDAQGAPLPDRAVTALLIGTDSRDGDLGGMADVIVLVQLSEDHEHLTLVSVARDSFVDVPGH